VLKDNAGLAIQSATPITVTARGGKILLNGRVIQAIDRSLGPFEIGGRYLLFLQFIPETGAFAVSDVETSFQIRDSKTLPLTDNPATEEIQKRENTQTSIEKVRIAIVASGYKARP